MANSVRDPSFVGFFTSIEMITFDFLAFESRRSRDLISSQCSRSQLTDKPHIHSTLQVKPDPSLITSTVTLKFDKCNHCFNTLGTRGFSRVRREFSVLAEGWHILGRRPKRHYKDLTETGNRARKVSGTQSTALSNTSVKPNDNLRTVSTNTGDQLTALLICLISPNPPQAQNIFLLMITPLMTSHLFH